MNFLARWTIDDALHVAVAQANVLHMLNNTDAYTTQLIAYRSTLITEPTDPDSSMCDDAHMHIDDSHEADYCGWLTFDEMFSSNA